MKGAFLMLLKSLRLNRQPLTPAFSNWRRQNIFFISSTNPSFRFKMTQLGSSVEYVIKLLYIYSAAVIRLDGSTYLNLKP